MPLQPRFASLTYISILLLTACAPAAATPAVLPVTPTGAQAPTSTAPIQANVEIIGEPEIVFNWETQHCPEPNAPDLPMRPFRDAEGMININLSAPTNYRLIGPDLDHMEVDCAPTLVSDFDPDPAHYNHAEWIGATYTLDGRTVYAIVHNEFYGEQSSRWDSRRDFGSEQGANNWHYNYWNGSTYQPMDREAGSERWQGPRRYCQASDWGLHPDASCDPALTWISPMDGEVLFSGTVADADPGGGDGVIVTILKNSEQLWSQSIDNGDTAIYDFSLRLEVSAGDAVYVRVNQRGNNNNDSTQITARVNLGSEPCPSEDRNRCFNAMLTYAVSTDGGRTFTQPPAPAQFIAGPTKLYTPDAGSFAVWQPSNIVLNPADGYYYALINRIYAPYQLPNHVNAACVMRTQALDDPASWRAWDGDGFDLQLADPYLNPDLDPETSDCAIVSSTAITYGLTYNTYLEAFIATGQAFGNVAQSGFYYMTSTDLVHWSRLYLLMAADLVQTTDGPFLAYPALVDPDSPSMSFDVTGQDPYLYFSSFQAPSLSHVDLMRVRVHFEK